MSPVRIEPVIPENVQRHNYASDRAATGIGKNRTSSKGSVLLGLLN